jgi:hypothetical protein
LQLKVNVRQKGKEKYMRMNARRMIIAVACVVCVSLAIPAKPCRAGDPVEPGRATPDKLLRAVEANDYDSFVADANDVFKAALTKPLLQSVSVQFAPRLKKGYACSYFGELTQQGCRVLLWKVTYKGGGDDTLAKLVLKDGKVAGFWLQ